MSESVTDEKRWFHPLPFKGEWEMIDKNEGVMYTGAGNVPNVHFLDYQKARPSINFSPLLSYKEYVSLQEGWEQTQYIDNSTKKIDSEEYNDAFEILPPGRHGRTQGIEYFYMPEAYTSNIYTWYLSCNGVFIKLMERSSVSSDELVRKFKLFEA